MNKSMSQAELKILQEMTLDGKSDKEIAAKLGRNEQTIARRRKKLGLIKGGNGTLRTDPETTKAVSINQASGTDKDKINQWKEYLKATPQYNKVQASLNDEQLEYFVHQWAVHHLELEDIKPSEEYMIEKMIMLDIRIQENQKSLKEILTFEDEVKAKLAGRELDTDNTSDILLREMIISYNNNKRDLNKEYTVLINEFQSVQKQLNLSREQRESRMNIGGDTLLSLIKSMNDRDRRKEMGEYSERMRISGENATKKFKKPHDFGNGEFDPIILDGADPEQVKGLKSEE